MLTICLAECAHLAITVSQISEILVENRHFLIAPVARAFDAPVRGVPNFPSG